MTINSTFVVPPSPTGIYTISVGTGGSGGTIGDINGTGGSGINSITRSPPHLIDPNVLNPFIKDHEIQGNTIMAEYVLPPNYLGLKESEIKKLLVEKLVQEMYKVNNQHNIEFTQMKKVDTDEMVYRARIHVVPDTQVRIIRELKNAKT